MEYKNHAPADEYDVKHVIEAYQKRQREDF